MSNEIVVESEVVVVEEKKQGRGVVGTGSFGSRLKSLHAKSGRGLSLKTFVREQAAAGNEDAKKWFAAKKGACNQKRSEASLKRIQLQRSATKLAKKSKGKGGGKSSEEKAA